MSNLFECSFDGFKKNVKDFMDIAHDLNSEELHGAFRVVSLSYLGMNEPMWQSSAAIALGMASRVFDERTLELM
jgi:hypothetical protein